MRSFKEYIETGKIINTHGVTGELKLEVWCDDIKEFTKIKSIYLDENGKTKLNISSSRVAGNFILEKFEGIQTLEAALKYKNKIFYIHRNDINIPEDGYLLCDLIGIDVIDFETGKKYGILKEILQRPSGEIYVIKTQSGEAMLPGVDEFIKKVDVNCAVYIKPIEGIFEEI